MCKSHFRARQPRVISRTYNVRPIVSDNPNEREFALFVRNHSDSILDAVKQKQRCVSLGLRINQRQQSGYQAILADKCCCDT